MAGRALWLGTQIKWNSQPSSLAKWVHWLDSAHLTRMGVPLAEISAWALLQAECGPLRSEPW